MLTTAELTSMRATIETALPDTCTIRRNTPTSDGGGGTTDGWADLATGVLCGIAPVGGGEAPTGVNATSGSRINDESTHIVTLPDGQDVTEQDQIVIVGQTYRVTLVRKRAAWELSRRVECREVAG